MPSASARAVRALVAPRKSNMSRAWAMRSTSLARAPFSTPRTCSRAPSASGSFLRTRSASERRAVSSAGLSTGPPAPAPETQRVAQLRRGWVKVHRADFPGPPLEGVDLPLGICQPVFPDRRPDALEAGRVIAVEVEQQLAVEGLVPGDPLQ